MSPLTALLWAKHRIGVHWVASVRRESRLKVAFVSISAVLLWFGLFGLAKLAFGLFEAFGAEILDGARLSVADLVMSRLLSVFALSVFVLLIFSNVLVAYATLFRAREMTFLVQSPLPTTTLFLGRFYECVSFSSWASAFLGSPVLLAYGIESSAPPWFYVALLPYYVPFVIIPAAIGSILALLLVKGVARIRHRSGPLAILGAGLVVGLFVYFRSKLVTPDLSDTNSFQTLLETLGRTQSPLLPSWWLSQGLLSAATGEFGTALFHFLLLAANALLFLWLATMAADAWFYDGWTALQGADELRPKRRESATGGGVLGRLESILRFVPEPTRSLVVKDLRLFWREPTQWSQFLLFFGIMALYLANVDSGRLSGGAVDPKTWQAWGTLLNLTACMLILASLTTRFIYPLISLEGRRIWILGLSPVTMRQIVWQKFWLSVATASFFTVGLAVLSALKLELDPLAFWLSIGGVAATTLALSGLAVGLGSLYPNFEEDNPSRVVSGMGGTLNFLLSLLYILLVTAGLAVVLLWHDLEEHFGGEAFHWAVAGTTLWIVVLTAVTCLVPLRLGLRNLERVEL